jgi:hypothetical protein
MVPAAFTWVDDLERWVNRKIGHRWINRPHDAAPGLPAAAGAPPPAPLPDVVS